MSDPRTQTALTAPDVERIADAGRPRSLIDASLSAARSISQTMTGVIQPQIDTHTTAITAVQGVVTTQGGLLASAKTQLDTQDGEITKARGDITTQGHAITAAQTRLDTQGGEITKARGDITTQGNAITAAQTRLDTHDTTLTGLQTHLTSLGDTTARHDQAITAALLGEDGHIFRLDGAVVELARRVKRLEDHPPRGESPPAQDVPSDQAREMREANDALRERVGAMETAIRELLAQSSPQGPQGGGPRSSRQR
jgi:chromosome segregation ATPase